MREWAENISNIETLSEKVKKQKHKERASLEKYVLQMLLGKKYYLRLKYKRKELTKDEAVKKLIKAGCSEEITIETVKLWEAEK